MKKFFQDFKEFINKGNVVDMAVGVVVATAFVVENGLLKGTAQPETTYILSR